IVIVYFLAFTPRLPPSSSLFPYTTLFRSLLFPRYPFPNVRRVVQAFHKPHLLAILPNRQFLPPWKLGCLPLFRPDMRVRGEQPRSEEHTSELQSRFDLVCRLLLEKKKQYN